MMKAIWVDLDSAKIAAEAVIASEPKIKEVRASLEGMTNRYFVISDSVGEVTLMSTWDMFGREQFDQRFKFVEGEVRGELNEVVRL